VGKSREKSKTLPSSSSSVCVQSKQLQVVSLSIREQRGDDSLAVDEAVTKLTLEISGEWLLLLLRLETY